LSNEKLNDYKQVVQDMVIPPSFVQIEEVEIE
jgi:hypothetical protein